MGTTYFECVDYVIINQIFDLKGSLRNRLASEKAPAEARFKTEVLLDENFINCNLS